MTDKVKDAQHDDCFAAFKAAEARADRLQRWKEAVEIAWTAGMLGMEHESLMGGKKLSAHEFITSLKVAMRKAETEFQATNPRRPLLCGLCQHTLVDNSHGADQNDFNGDQHSGRCSYCKFCNGFVAAPVPEPEDEPEYCNAGPSRNIPIEEMRAVLAENEVSADTLGRKYVTEMIDNIRANVGEDKARRSEPPARKDETLDEFKTRRTKETFAAAEARKDELGTCEISGNPTGYYDHSVPHLEITDGQVNCVRWHPVAPQASPEAPKEMAILRPCKCEHGWESHEPERCNESGCRCEEFRPQASPEAGKTK